MSVFDDMTVFVRAVEVGSFSGAAQQLGIAKSIVSRRILSLESRLGTSMFHRSTRRLSLTETGLAYYERALALVRTGGLIVVDNTLWGGQVLDNKSKSADTLAIRQFNDRLALDSRIHLSLLPVGDGLTLALKL